MTESKYRLLTNQIAQLEKSGTSDPKELATLRETSVQYMSELKKLNRSQWEHDHETVDFGDDR